MNNNKNNLLKDILSEEELETLAQLEDKIYAKLSESINKNTPENPPYNFDISSPYAFDEINQPNHISNNDRELIFYIRGEISTIDKINNKYLSLNRCLDEAFHIPIGSGVDPKTKIHEFMSTLEKDLSTLAKKIDKPTDGKSK
jgi:hypothetical protein